MILLLALFQPDSCCLYIATEHFGNAKTVNPTLMVAGNSNGNSTLVACNSSHCRLNKASQNSTTIEILHATACVSM